MLFRVAASAEEPPTTSSSAEPALMSKPMLRPPPQRPPKEITRAPPSPRTRIAKERQGDGSGPPSTSGRSGGPNGRPEPPRRSSTSPTQAAQAPPAPAPQPAPAGGNNARPGSGPVKGKPLQLRKGAKGAEDDGPRRRAQARKPQGNMTAENRRTSRDSRKKARVAARIAGQAVREEIIEVGPEGMSVGDLAFRLAVNPAEVVKVLFMKGVMVQVGAWLSWNLTWHLLEYGTRIPPAWTLYQDTPCMTTVPRSPLHDHSTRIPSA